MLTLPLWLIPPLALLLPPLILGWLTYRVMAHDVLAEHADAAERRRACCASTARRCWPSA